VFAYATDPTSRWRPAPACPTIRPALRRMPCA